MFHHQVNREIWQPVRHLQGWQKNKHKTSVRQHRGNIFYWRETVVTNVDHMAALAANLQVLRSAGTQWPPIVRYTR